MKKILQWKPREIITAIGFVFLLAIALVPMLRLCFYAAPYYDDYSYGRYVRVAVEQGGGIKEILAACYDSAHTSFYAWQGTFSSIFLMSLMPAAFGEQYYWIGPAFLILLFTVSILCLAGVVSKHVFKADIYRSISFMSICSLMLLTLVYSAQQAFYWYNAGIHYIGGHSFMLFFAAVLISLGYDLSDEKINIRKVIILITFGTILSVLVGGSNYVSALQGLLILAIVTGMTFFYAKKKGLYLSPVIIVYLLSFLQSATAPGNEKRAQWYVGWGYSPVKAVIYSFIAAVKWLPKFFGFRTLLFMLLLLPVIYRMVKEAEFKFRAPWLIVAASFCFYATGFTPNLYATGRIDLARVVNAIKITFQIMLIIDEVWITGHIYQKYLSKKENPPDGFVHWWAYPVWALALLTVFHFQSDQAGNYAPYGAYYYIHTGEAEQFRNQYLERVEALTGDSSDVVLSPYRFKPWFLCKREDIKTDAESDINRVMAAYYHKSSVRLEE
jgi:hypothetical protein